MASGVAEATGPGTVAVGVVSAEMSVEDKDGVVGLGRLVDEGLDGAVAAVCPAVSA